MGACVPILGVILCNRSTVLLWVFPRVYQERSHRRCQRLKYLCKLRSLNRVGAERVQVLTWVRKWMVCILLLWSWFVEGHGWRSIVFSRFASTNQYLVAWVICVFCGNIWELVHVRYLYLSLSATYWLDKLISYCALLILISLHPLLLLRDLGIELLLSRTWALLSLAWE